MAVSDWVIGCGLFRDATLAVIICSRRDFLSSSGALASGLHGLDLDFKFGSGIPSRPQISLVEVPRDPWNKWISWALRLPCPAAIFIFLPQIPQDGYVNKKKPRSGCPV